LHVGGLPEQFPNCVASNNISGYDVRITHVRNATAFDAARVLAFVAIFNGGKNAMLHCLGGHV